MQKILFYSLLLIVSLSCSTSHYLKDIKDLDHNDPDKLNSPYVVMISIDGFRHDYIDLYHPPFLSSIQNKGFRAKSLIPIFPSKTFPNHYSLITGMYSDKHKLVANRFYDPERNQDYQLGNPTTRDGSWYAGEPLWTSVKKQGLLSASYFWVGSDANIGNSYPSYYYPYKGSTPNEKRTGQIVDWLKMPSETRPHFLTLYFSIVDSAGHHYGPRSEEVKKAVLKVDHLIGDMVAQIDKLKLPVNYVIVSDHGMKTIDPKKAIFIGDYLNSLRDKVMLREQGPITLGYFKKGTSQAEKKSIYKSLKKVSGAKLYKRNQRPKRWHYSKLPRQGDFLLLTSSGSYIFPGKRPKNFKGKSGGTHGYDPQNSPEMDGIFLSFGPRVKHEGVIPKTKNINIYPYVMDLLKLKVISPIDGTAKHLKQYIKD